MGTFLDNHWAGFLFAIYFLLSGVAQSLKAPTAQSSEHYAFWFRFVNYCSANWGRARNNARIEDSPNFLAAAEAYHQARLKQLGE